MWAYESVFYQIYPIGFCGAPHQNDGQTIPRISKITNWSTYLESLGINALIFNPVFDSDNHGYDTRDFKKIDCRLGTNHDFATVCEDLHNHNIRIVLDGVFNHVGRGFWAFQDVIAKRETSIYKDWFFLDFNNNNGYNDNLSYDGWEGHYELVKLNLLNPAVVDYLLDCVKGWIDEFDIDGLRLDVAYSLDHNFLRKLRHFSQELKPDFVLIGEVLFGDYNVIVNQEMLHSCTNYECYKGLFSSMNDKNLFEISHSLNRQFGPEDWCIYRDMHLMTFVDNHDVTRIASILKDKNHLSLVYGILMGMPGIPCLYYGSEWGELGEKNPDNDYALRPCFPAPAPNALTYLIKQFIHLRQHSNALCYGGYRNVIVTNMQLIFERYTDTEHILIAINISDQSHIAQHDILQGEMVDLLTNSNITLHGSFDMPAYSITYLLKN